MAAMRWMYWTRWFVESGCRSCCRVGLESSDQTVMGLMQNFSVGPTYCPLVGNKGKLIG